VNPFDAVFRWINGLQRYPPIHLRRQVGCLGDIGGGGSEFVSYLKLLAGLEAGHSVWDVGCGCGFLELALEEAAWTGRLVGTDIHRPSIEWAQRTIAKRRPDFRFVHSDIRHAAYWPAGALSAQQWLSGFDGRDFDVVVAKSLFTHMLPDELDLYLDAISTRLTARGAALITCFLLNPTQDALGASNQIRFTRPAAGSVYGVRYLAAPTAAVAYDEPYLTERLRQHGLTIRDGVHFGYWSGRKDGLSFQDILVLRKA
jgi:SAM-dependent methyltransferase